MNPVENLERWQNETIILNGDEFYRSLHEGIDSAKDSIDMEFYIFESDQIGQRTVAKLIEAAKRGVNVRLMVDGVGAWNFGRTYGESLNLAGISWKIYHELPFYKFLKKPWKIFNRRYFRLIGLINKRNHRKVCCVDGKHAWVGSLNISNVHTQEFYGDKAWHDIAIKVSGSGVSDLVVAFEHALKPVKVRSWRGLKSWYAREKRYQNPLVRLNVTGRMRRRNYREILLGIRRARKEIFIMTAYFVPKRSLVRALKLSAQKGCDVRILVPKKSDVFFMPWIISAYYDELLKNGIQVYEYIPSMLHAKAILTDDWAIIGSTNLNHRSIMHDLEVDLVVTYKENRDLLRKQFLNDLTKSDKIERQDLDKRGIYQRVVGRFLLAFRDWL